MVHAGNARGRARAYVVYLAEKAWGGIRSGAHAYLLGVFTDKVQAEVLYSRMEEIRKNQSSKYWKRRTAITNVYLDEVDMGPQAEQVISRWR